MTSVIANLSKMINCGKQQEICAMWKNQFVVLLSCIAATNLECLVEKIGTSISSDSNHRQWTNLYHEKCIVI